MKKLSIVICTYNRSTLLKACIDSLLCQTISDSQFEIIIVDNNSIDNTRLVVKEYMEKYSFINYIAEPNIGLSYARNAGYRYANTDWILYLDDDAIAFPNMVESAIETAQKYNFQCFGGIIISYFDNNAKIPRWWLADRFESNEFLLKTFQGVCTLGKESPYGGILVVKKELLVDLNGFKTEFGMKGNKIGYGEETDFVSRIRQKGVEIGINTDMRIYHLVSNNKFKFSWQLKAAYAKGYSATFMANNSNEIDKYYVMKYFIQTPIRYFKTVGYAIKSIFLNKHYCIENFILTILGAVHFDFGKVVAFFDIKKEKLSHRTKQNNETAL